MIVPIVSDREALQDFTDSLREHIADIERDVARLRIPPVSPENVGRLFRALHNIKGDAAICRVELAVAIVHPIETIVVRVRGEGLPFTDLLAETLLLAIDRLELAVARLSCGDALDGLQLQPLVEGLERLTYAAPNAVDEGCGEVIEAVTGFRPRATAVTSRNRASGGVGGMRLDAPADLRFFHTLAQQFEARSPLFAGRATRLLRLAVDTNQMAGEAIDPLQLEAAVYMHDVGMMLLPESVWLKASEMTPAERVVLRAHPDYAAGLLSRMAGWAAAAEMVAQHHETPDGHGYPAGLAAAEICAGARVLAIVDAFEAVMLKHTHRGRTRSVLRAIAEINACDRQFAPEWIEPFNRVIRRTLEAR